MDLDPSTSGAPSRSRRQPKPSNKAAEAEKERQEKEVQKKAREAARQKKRKPTTSSSKTKDSRPMKKNPTQAQKQISIQDNATIPNGNITTEQSQSQLPAASSASSSSSASTTPKEKAVQMGITPHIWRTFSMGVKEAVALSCGCLSVGQFEEGVLQLNPITPLAANVEDATATTLDADESEVTPPHPTGSVNPPAISSNPTTVSANPPPISSNPTPSRVAAIAVSVSNSILPTSNTNEVNAPSSVNVNTSTTDTATDTASATETASGEEEQAAEKVVDERMALWPEKVLNDHLATPCADGSSISCVACLGKGKAKGKIKMRHAYKSGAWDDHKKGKKHITAVKNIEAEKLVKKLKKKKQGAMANYFAKKPKKNEDDMSDDEEDEEVASKRKVDVDLTDTGYVIASSLF